MKINYVKGDATKPVGEGNKIIVHICNDIGAWGAGFVLALSKRWKGPEQGYRYRNDPNKHKLGNVQYCAVENDIMVANMIAQHNIGPDSEDNPPIRYDALKKCLQDVNRVAQEIQASVHMPRIGCGLAGGDWSKVSKIVEETLEHVNIYVYDFE